jgi:hypothetical protein
MLARVVLAIVTIVSASVTSAPLARASSFSRLNTFNGTAAELPSGAVVDASGNTYVIGAMNATTDFDSNPGMSSSLTAAGLSDMFVVKLNSAGGVVWNIHIGAMNYIVSPTGIAIRNQVLYISGSFTGTVNFDARNNTAPLTPLGAEDAFLLILDTDGNFVRVEQFGGPTAKTIATAVAVNNIGDQYLIGYFDNQVDFDPLIGTSKLTATGATTDMFALKLNSIGQLAWAESFPGPAFQDPPLSIVLDSVGNAIIAGKFALTVDFHATSGGSTRTATGLADGFVLKLDNAGHTLWIDVISGLGSTTVTSLAIDSVGNVYIGGVFFSSVDFDPGPEQHVVDPHGLGQEAFVLKLSPSGTFGWVATYAGDNNVSASSLAVDASGNVYQIGAVDGPTDFDPGPGEVKPTINGHTGYVLKLDSAGSFVAVDLFQGPMNAGVDSTATNILLDASSNLIVSGTYKFPTDFDPGPGVVPATVLGSVDTFVVKLAQSAPPVNGLPATPAILKDTPLVFSRANGNAISISDADNGSSPLKVTLTATNGALTLKGVTGLTFSAGDGTADQTMTFTGTLAPINAALDGLTFTPSAGFTGSASLQITSFDQVGPTGGQTDTDTLTITVSPPNQTPLPPVASPVPSGTLTASSDSYTMLAQTALNVPAPGLLANDIGPTGTTLTASQVTGPSHGSVSLNPNGSFTYTSNANFYGSDAFTYRVSDGTTQSNVATVTITVTPTQCAPRPKVQATPIPGAGKLSVHVEATPLSTQQNNSLRELRFGTFQNGKVTLNGQAITSGQTVTVPVNTVAVDFTVERSTPGQPTTVPFTVADGCGDWPTFVGGGTGAGF